MAIGNININNYKLILGGSQGEHEQFKSILTIIMRAQLTEMNMNEIDLYNLKEEAHDNKSGTVGQRLCIFANATFVGAGVAYEFPEGEGFHNFLRFLPIVNNDTVVILSDSGIPIAEWREETHELNILFNIFKEYNQQSLDAFTYIMQKFNEQVWYVKSLQDSWKHTSDRNELTKAFTARLELQKRSDLTRAERDIRNMENNIRDYAQSIKQASDNIGIKRRFITVETENLKNVSVGLIKDLDLIIAHEKVKDLKIKDGKFIVYTHPLIITSTKGKRYYGGEYRFELNPDQSDIRFFGSNTKRGLWTHNDPHPHVDGNDGHACLGNVSSTIAELSSQMQIYALALVGIDFLESANTDDSAGANVIRWDEVDKDGNIIDKSKKKADDVAVPAVEEDLHICDDCGEGARRLITVYNYIDDDGDERDEHQVCQSCRDDNYHYDEDLDLIMADGWEG